MGRKLSRGKRGIAGKKELEEGRVTRPDPTLTHLEKWSPQKNIRVQLGRTWGGGKGE